MNLSFKS